MAKIIVMTGASGVGKTSLINKLVSKLDKNDFEFNKFDSIEIPTSEEMTEKYGSPSKWQETKTYEWINKLIDELGNKTKIFEGQMNIDFIIQGFKNNNFADYTIVLIDCSEEEMNRRLIKERQQPELANEDMSNWLKYLRKQAKQNSIEMIDSTNLTIEEMESLFIGKVLTT